MLLDLPKTTTQNVVLCIAASPWQTFVPGYSLQSTCTAVLRACTCTRDTSTINKTGLSLSLCTQTLMGKILHCMYQYIVHVITCSNNIGILWRWLMFLLLMVGGAWLMLVAMHVGLKCNMCTNHKCKMYNWHGWSMKRACVLCHVPSVTMLVSWPARANIPAGACADTYRPHS